MSKWSIPQPLVVKGESKDPDFPNVIKGVFQNRPDSTLWDIRPTAVPTGERKRWEGEWLPGTRTFECGDLEGRNAWIHHIYIDPEYTASFPTPRLHYPHRSTLAPRWFKDLSFPSGALVSEPFPHGTYQGPLTLKMQEENYFYLKIIVDYSLLKEDAEFMAFSDQVGPHSGPSTYSMKDGLVIASV